jgi:hypothetical protein
MLEIVTETNQLNGLFQQKSFRLRISVNNLLFFRLIFWLKNLKKLFKILLKYFISDIFIQSFTFNEI